MSKTQDEIIDKAMAPLDMPDFWPGDMIHEFDTVSRVRKALNFEFQSGGKVDIHTGDQVVQYMAELQVMSASSAELMGRLRKRLEEARGAAIIAAMDDQRVDFRRLSATLQKQYVDSQIATILAVYEYAEYLSKRISYSLDAGRSFLSFIKEEMYNNRTIPQR